MKSIRQLGFLPLVYLGLYRLGLWTGFWRVMTPTWHDKQIASLLDEDTSFSSPAFNHLVQSTLQDFFNRQPDAAAALLEEAEEILEGQVRLFGGPARPLQLVPPGELRHWTVWENGWFPPDIDPDIKLIWEPARFGWAVTLSRAFALTGEDRFAAAFWEYFHNFQEANPLNRGPNWCSAQEIALRLIAWCFAGRVMAAATSSSPENIRALQTAIAEHAGRLSLTRVYALAQNNNHLLTESAGLLTAGVFLPAHPRSKTWIKSGWQWSIHALDHQIEPDGTYSQHSNNYHRLMLMAALWVQALGQNQAIRFTVETQKRMAAASRWLEEQVDPSNGQVPNLGSNDGANILPLSSSGFTDYRPIVQTASQRFRLKSPFPPGAWDETALWLEVIRQRRIDHVSGSEIRERTLPRANYQTGPGSLSKKQLEELPPSPHLILKSENSLGGMRAVAYHSRPFHADQLHVDLWWQGINIACDAGTYRYNASQPWENSLSRSAVHNTVTINGRDQMASAGKFLWLDWAQAEQVFSDRIRMDEITVQHNGYQGLGCRHRRRLTLIKSDAWRVEDFILPLSASRQPVRVCLHWLIREYPWELVHKSLNLTTPVGHCSLVTSIDVEDPKTVVEKEYRQVVKAGKTIIGHGKEDVTLGWFSPTYDLKLPALSYLTYIEAIPPIRLVSDWSFFSEDSGG
ncbi:MAG: alginate lyase family protein [Anaerolineaceae bacterium]